MGSNTPQPNRAARVAALQKLVDGLTLHAGRIPAFTIRGRRMTPQEIIDALNLSIALAGDVATLQSTWHEAVVADAHVSNGGRRLVSSITQGILIAFADREEVLADFGLTARRVAERTDEQKRAAAAKGRLTRLRNLASPSHTPKQ